MSVITNEIQNLKKKWNSICTQCYKDKQTTNIPCDSYFPYQPNKESNQKCDLFNCNMCNINPKIKNKEENNERIKLCCSSAKGNCIFKHNPKTKKFGKCQEKTKLSIGIWNVNFKDYVLKCGIVYIGIFFQLPKNQLCSSYIQKYYKIIPSTKVKPEDEDEKSEEDDDSVEIDGLETYDITDKNKYFGVRCINIEYQPPSLSFFSGVTWALWETINAIVTLYPGITNISEKVGPATQTPGNALHYFFTMIKPTDDYRITEFGIKYDEEQLRFKKIGGDDAVFNTKPGNHKMEDIDQKIEEQKKMYLPYIKKKGQYIPPTEHEAQSLPKILFKRNKFPHKESKTAFYKFIDWVYPKALNFFKYRIYIDPCGQGVCATIAYNLFFLYTKLCKDIPFTFIEKSFITLTFIFHAYPTNKRGPQWKGWQFSRQPSGNDLKDLLKSSPERTKGCTNCEEYNFEYPQGKMNACDRGCERRVNKILDSMNGKFSKQTERIVKSLCCDRGLMEKPAELKSSMRPGDRIEAQYLKSTHANKWESATVVGTSHDNKDHVIVIFDNLDGEVKIPVTHTRIPKCPRIGTCELDIREIKPLFFELAVPARNLNLNLNLDIKDQKLELEIENQCKILSEEDCLKYKFPNNLKDKIVKNLKDGVPSNLKFKCKWREDRQNSFLRRSFYYYIHQVFGQFSTPLKENELLNFFPKSWKKGWEEMQEKTDEFTREQWPDHLKM